MASQPSFESAKRYLAANLARLRAARRWSQQQTADAMGIDLKHLQKLEYAVLNPTLRTVVAAAEAFGAPLARLFRQSTKPPIRRPVGRPIKPRRRVAGGSRLAPVRLPAQAV
jgi:transcriptional regulator with XRE-family HTH domain